MPDDLRLLYRTLDTYHETQNTDKVDLHLLDLANLFFANKPKDKEFYETLFDSLDSYQPNEDTVKQLLKSIKRSRILRDLSITSYEVAESKKPAESLDPLLADLNSLNETVNEEEFQFVTTSLQSILDSTVKHSGLRWRLPSLNKSMGSLRRGDFGFVFARPETGKTTFLASEVSHFLTQLKEDSGPIIWFNNEEQGDKVMLRVYQAFFGVTLDELLADVPKFEKAFEEASKNKFKLFDSAQINKHQVEAICKSFRPVLILFDQIDKIQGFEADRPDLQLGSIYQWARELAKLYGPVVGVCQADGTGENTRWLTMQNVSNAKTSKQAEADWILGIGTIHDTGWESIRFLHLSKNKLIGDQDTDHSNRHGKWEVMIKPSIARYEDFNE